ELRKKQDRLVELLRQVLHVTGNMGHFSLTRFGALEPSPDELEVVDDHEGQVWMLQRMAPRNRPNLGNRQRRARLYVARVQVNFSRCIRHPLLPMRRSDRLDDSFLVELQPPD